MKSRLDEDTLESIRQDAAKEEWAKELEYMDWRDEHPLR
jgi:hypothetical protein